MVGIKEAYAKQILVKFEWSSVLRLQFDEISIECRHVSVVIHKTKMTSCSSSDGYFATKESLNSFKLPFKSFVLNELCIAFENTTKLLVEQLTFDCCFKEKQVLKLRARVKSLNYFALKEEKFVSVIRQRNDISFLISIYFDEKIIELNCDTEVVLIFDWHKFSSTITSFFTVESHRQPHTSTVEARLHFAKISVKSDVGSFDAQDLDFRNGVLCVDNVLVKTKKFNFEVRSPIIFQYSEKNLLFGHTKLFVLDLPRSHVALSNNLVSSPILKLLSERCSLSMTTVEIQFEDFLIFTTGVCLDLDSSKRTVCINRFLLTKNSQEMVNANSICAILDSKTAYMPAKIEDFGFFKIFEDSPICFLFLKNMQPIISRISHSLCIQSIVLHFDLKSSHKSIPQNFNFQAIFFAFSKYLPFRIEVYETCLFFDDVSFKMRNLSITVDFCKDLFIFAKSNGPISIQHRKAYFEPLLFDNFWLLLNLIPDNLKNSFLQITIESPKIFMSAISWLFSVLKKSFRVRENEIISNGKLFICLKQTLLQLDSKLEFIMKGFEMVLDFTCFSGIVNVNNAKLNHHRRTLLFKEEFLCVKFKFPSPRINLTSISNQNFVLNFHEIHKCLEHSKDLITNFYKSMNFSKDSATELPYVVRLEARHPKAYSNTSETLRVRENYFLNLFKVNQVVFYKKDDSGKSFSPVIITNQRVFKDVFDTYIDSFGICWKCNLNVCVIVCEGLELILKDAVVDIDTFFTLRVSVKTGQLRIGSNHVPVNFQLDTIYKAHSKTISFHLKNVSVNICVESLNYFLSFFTKKMLSTSAESSVDSQAFEIPLRCVKILPISLTLSVLAESADFSKAVSKKAFYAAMQKFAILFSLKNALLEFSEFRIVGPFTISHAIKAAVAHYSAEFSLFSLSMQFRPLQLISRIIANVKKHSKSARKLRKIIRQFSSENMHENVQSPAF